jgi:hypothetical protein
VSINDKTKCQQHRIHKERPVLQDATSDDERNSFNEYSKPQKCRRRTMVIEEEEDNNEDNLSPVDEQPKSQKRRRCTTVIEEEEDNEDDLSPFDKQPKPQKRHRPTTAISEEDDNPRKSTRDNEHRAYVKISVSYYYY